MGADASIFNGYANSIRSVDDYTMDRQKREALKQANDLNALQLAATKQKDERENGFRALLSTLPADPSERVKALRLANTPEAWGAADSMEKNQLDMGETRAKTGKLESEVKGSDLENKIKAHNYSLQQLQAVNDPMTAQLWAANELKSGNVTPEQFLQGFSKIPSDPAEFQRWKRDTLQGAVSVPENAKISAENARNTANNATSRANNAASNAVTMRGQNMTDARARQTIDQGGKPPAGYRFTPDGNMEPIPGGPADAKAQALANQKAVGVTDVDSAVATLRDAYDRLEKGGGITSTENGPIGNIAAAASSSGVGQAVGKYLGTNNQSARNDIAMSRPALLASLMKATGMSAKQMDSNAELKLWLATATDPTLDVESNRRALDAIERKYITARGAPAPRVPSGSSGGWTVTRE